MLFTPKKRGRDWYWFNMVFLYLFSLMFGAAAIAVPILSNADSSKTVAALMFLLGAVVTWTLGRRCSKVVVEMSADHRPKAS